MDIDILIFIALIFAAAFLLLTGLTMPVFGENRQAKKRLKKRVANLDESKQHIERTVELRKDEIKGLFDWEKRLEILPALNSLRQLINQSGHHISAFRLLILSLLLAVVSAATVWYFTHMLLAVIIAGVAVGALPMIKIMQDRNKRFARFEEQLPDAIDVMKRALQAGHPFNESLNLVALELDDPIASEFGKTFAELNYGSDMKWALLGLLERVPSVNVMALITSVSVQRETGGNLVEILNKLSRVIRERFKFSRKVRTLSAEGRMSAWILSLMPFGLCGLIGITTPEYLPILFKSDTGKDLLMGAAVGMVLGIYWIRNIIRIEV
ncbi:MAG: secretion system protein [Moraxellaceae bacterium]|nr:MAG: secretion system protein [Moraxellaceae bacterium]